ncbi:23S rRNA (guanosine(2251)-2'-O)-methyltransferase RlmB, partial [Ameyamaea chiangmaiensis]
GRRPARGGGGLWLYGLHAVAAALANPRRVYRQLVVTDEGERALQAEFGQALPVRAERADRQKLDMLCGRDAVHQGVALQTELLDAMTVEEGLDHRPGPVLVLDQVTDPRNVGAILRSAAAFGVSFVLVQDRHAPEETGTLAKAASGALEIVPMVRVVNIARALSTLQTAGLWVVGLDAGGGILDGAGFGERRVALVLGAEGEGLRRLTRETCDEIAGVRMSDQMESLNVSNAAAVALYELSRGRL